MVAATGGLVLGGMSVASAQVPRGDRAPHVHHDSQTAHAASTFDTCLIGTWHDNPGLTSTIWNQRKVQMHAHGGDIDHINASGIDHDNWRPSKKIVGKAQGHKLVERIRGVNHTQWSTNGNKLKQVEQGWSSGATNKYVYEGHHYTGYLDQTGTFHERYTCHGKKLKYFNKKGKKLGSETRISTKP
jgi:hypothetical protein